MPKLKKVIIPFLTISFFCFFLFLLAKKAALAQVDSLPTQADSEQENTDTSWTGGDNAYFVAQSSMNWLLNAVTGPVTPEGQSMFQNKGGAIGKIGGLVAYMISNPPVSTGEYLADLGSNLGLPIKSAYAQGTGWQALRPVLPVWKAFRNVAYMAFVIIFVVIGFMIMFRAKINPQTVISIQVALPRIIVTLLLVTFSYAIAGLMIDLIYIGIYLVVGILHLSGILTSTSEPLNLLLSKNPFGLVYMTDGADIFLQAPGEALQDLVEGLFGDWFADTILSEAFGGLAKLILGVALLFSLCRLFFSLLLSFLGIVLSVIFAPFNILFNALPGSQSFMSWLKNLFANVIVFPAVAGMFLIAAILIGPRTDRGQAECGQFDNRWCVRKDVGFYPAAEKDPPDPIWVPPMLNIGREGGAATINVFQGLIALGIIMMMPQVVTMIKKMLKVEPSGFGGAIVAGIMAGPRMIAAVPQTGWNLMTQLGYQPLKDKQTIIVRPEVPPPGES